MRNPKSSLIQKVFLWETSIASKSFRQNSCTSCCWKACASVHWKLRNRSRVKLGCGWVCKLTNNFCNWKGMLSFSAIFRGSCLSGELCTSRSRYSLGTNESWIGFGEESWGNKSHLRWLILGMSLIFYNTDTTDNIKIKKNEINGAFLIFWNYLSNYCSLPHQNHCKDDNSP